MTSALVVAVLLSSSPESEGHAALVKARQAMMADARLPWLLLASGSISDENGKERRFVVEWEPCRARCDVRGHLLAAAEAMLEAVSSVICGNDPLEDARVERNGTQMRLPRRVQLRAGSDREDWTIERIEIVPLP
jgi:hypothetical protein